MGRSVHQASLFAMRQAFITFFFLLLLTMNQNHDLRGDVSGALVLLAFKKEARGGQFSQESTG